MRVFPLPAGADTRSRSGLPQFVWLARRFASLLALAGLAMLILDQVMLRTLFFGASGLLGALSGIPLLLDVADMREIAATWYSPRSSDSAMRLAGITSVLAGVGLIAVAIILSE